MGPSISTLAHQNHWCIGGVIRREMRILLKLDLLGKIHHPTASTVHATTYAR